MDLDFSGPCDSGRKLPRKHRRNGATVGLPAPESIASHWVSMWTSTPVRVFLILVLLLGQVGLMVSFEMRSLDPQAGNNPTVEQLREDYEAFIDEDVHVAGKVINTDPTVISYGQPPDDVVEIYITGVDKRIRQGDTLRVYGTVQPGNTIHAIRVITITRVGRMYMYSISVVAGLWILSRFLRDWTFDIDEQGFTRRG